MGQNNLFLTISQSGDFIPLPSKFSTTADIFVKRSYRNKIDFFFADNSLESTWIHN
jgi:hypothetical protein